MLEPEDAQRLMRAAETRLLGQAGLTEGYRGDRLDCEEGALRLTFHVGTNTAQFEVVLPLPADDWLVQPWPQASYVQADEWVDDVWLELKELLEASDVDVRSHGETDDTRRFLEWKSLRRK